MNRYFYDLFVHYDLDHSAGRLYSALLRRLLPVPDIALLLVAAPDTIARRRPQYSREYLSAVGEAYSHLGQRFPEMIELRTDSDEATVEQLGLIVARVSSGTPAPASERAVNR
jgi:hypothetical protein